MLIGFSNGIRGAKRLTALKALGDTPIFLGLPLYGGRLGFLNLSQSGERPDR